MPEIVIKIESPPLRGVDQTIQYGDRKPLVKLDLMLQKPLSKEL